MPCSAQSELLQRQRTLRNFSKRQHQAIYEGLEKGYLHPVIGETFALKDAPKAHKEVIEGKSYGKIILIP